MCALEGLSPLKMCVCVFVCEGAVEMRATMRERRFHRRSKEERSGGGVLPWSVHRTSCAAWMLTGGDDGLRTRDQTSLAAFNHLCGYEYSGTPRQPVEVPTYAPAHRRTSAHKGTHEDNGVVI